MRISTPDKYFKRGSVVTFEDSFTYIRKCKLLRTLGIWWLPTEILEGVIENPIGTEEIPSFTDVVVDFLETEEHSPKLAKNFDSDIYNIYENISISLDTLQQLVDGKLNKAFGADYFNNYKVVRWLDPSTALIGVNQIDPIR